MYYDTLINSILLSDVVYCGSIVLVYMAASGGLCLTAPWKVYVSRGGKVSGLYGDYRNSLMVICYH